jgi:large subunit ribosomal protein L30
LIRAVWPPSGIGRKCMAKSSTPETSTVVSEAKKIQVKLVRSPIGYEKSQKATVKALGLKRMHQTVEHTDSPVVRGMIYKVQHLVSVTE